MGVEEVLRPPGRLVFKASSEGLREEAAGEWARDEVIDGRGEERVDMVGGLKYLADVEAWTAVWISRWDGWMAVARAFLFPQIIFNSRHTVLPSTHFTTTKMPTLQDQVAVQLLHSKSLPLSRSWLDTFIATSTNAQRSVPLVATTQTALFRVLSSDIRETLSTQNAASLLPTNISDASHKERRLQGPVPLQVLDIEDIGASLWSQTEAIERVERGEAIRGREIVRTVNVGEDGEERERNTATGGDGGGGMGPHRLTLQDAAGMRVVGIEMERIREVGVGKLAIGAKVLVRNATVARGVVLLTPECVTVLGGKIEALDRAWRQSRKLRLLARIEEMGREEKGVNGGPDDMEA